MITDRKRAPRYRARVPVMLTLQQAEFLASSLWITHGEKLNAGTRERWRAITMQASAAVVLAKSIGVQPAPRERARCAAREFKLACGARCTLGANHHGRMHVTRAGVQFN